MIIDRMSLSLCHDLFKSYLFPKSCHDDDCEYQDDCEIDEECRRMVYEETPLTINYTVSDKIVGSASQAVKYHKIEISAQRDESFFSEFLKAAHDFCDIKKDKTEIITYIFKTGYWQHLSK